MARTELERVKNSSGHKYQWSSTGRVHICSTCGTAEHHNGQYWWAGRWSLIEPPCDSNSLAQNEWFNSANHDPDIPALPDKKTGDDR